MPQLITGQAPTPPFRINRNSIFAKDLLACYPLHDPLFDLVTGGKGIPIGGTIGIKTKGLPIINSRGLDMSAANVDGVKDANFALPDAGGITISVWRFITEAPSQNPEAFQIGNNASGDRILSHFPWLDDVLYWDYGSNSASGRVSTDYSSYYGKVTHVVFWAEGDSGTGEGQGIQINGKDAATNANTGTPGTLTPLRIGISGAESSAGRGRGVLSFFTVWYGPKTQAFRRALWNPETRWDLYESQLNRPVYLAAAPPSGDIEGDLAATEAPDVASMVGQVEVSGALAATEAPDVAAMVGEAALNAALAVTEAPDVAAMVGRVEVQGDLVATEAPDVASMVGRVEVSGALVATEAADIAAMIGSVEIAGALAVTEAADIAAMVGQTILSVFPSWVFTSDAVAVRSHASGAVAVRSHTSDAIFAPTRSN